MSRDEQIHNLKRNIIAIGRILWEKELVSGLNGNISARVDEETILLTATRTCLGLLQEKDVLCVNLDGEVLDEEGEISSEWPMHTAIYKEFPDNKAVIHTHTTYTNAYFSVNDELDPSIFEARFCLGTMHAIPQTTPTVTDPGPVLASLHNNSIAVLKNHGVLAVGDNLFECFLLIQNLEDAVKTETIARIYRLEKKAAAKRAAPAAKPRRSRKKYRLFSTEHLQQLQKAVNSDPFVQNLNGAGFDGNLRLGVTGAEPQELYFVFRQGRLAAVETSGEADLALETDRGTWQRIFSRQMDPFVGISQKKVVLSGGLGRLSRIYVPLSRIFQLWQGLQLQEGKAPDNKEESNDG